jgi:hypothetical protein
LGAPLAGRRQNLLSSYRQEQAVDRFARLWRKAHKLPRDEYTGHLPFCFRDALKGNWVQARYAAARAVIVSQYWEGGITGNLEIWHPDGSLCKAGDYANDW